jgi:type II secretory pathway pseudopilin PulG
VTPLCRRRGRPRREAGYTVVELVAVMAILMTILTALTALFVSGAKAELDANRRFEAQNRARVAAEGIRRELRCANAVAIASATTIVVTLPANCPVVGSLGAIVVYATQPTSGRFVLQRAGTTVADYLTSGDVFAYTPPSASTLGMLNLDLRVNVNPDEGWKTWRLETDIVLRNTVRF